MLDRWCHFKHQYVSFNPFNEQEMDLFNLKNLIGFIVGLFNVMSTIKYVDLTTNVELTV